MTTQQEKIDAVSKCVDLYAVAESSLQAIKAQLDAVISGVDEAHAIGLGKQGEYLKIKNGLEVAKGHISAAMVATIEAHEKCTLVAKREDCDVALPTSYAVTETVTTMGGGDR